MRSAAELLPKVVSQGANVRPAGAFHGKAHLLTLQAQQFQGVDFHFHRRQVYRLVLPRQLVSAHPSHQLGGVRRRHLHQPPGKFAKVTFQDRCFGSRRHGLRSGLPRGIVGVRGETKMDGALISLAGFQVKLRESRRLAHGDRQHARGERVERSEVSHLPLMQNLTDARHNIMRGNARRLVDNQHPGDLGLAESVSGHG